MHHRFARRKQAFGIGVARRIRQITDHVLDDLIGRHQTKRGHIADVELDDFVALFLHLAGLVQHRSTDVVADVGELAGLGNGLQTDVSRPLGRKTYNLTIGPPRSPPRQRPP